MHKDEAQLKAPTDLSMFERLKGTIREILTRQLTSQVCIVWCITIIFVEGLTIWIVSIIKR